MGIGIKNKFFIGLQISDDNHKKTINSGFSIKVEIGETVLPKSIGKIIFIVVSFKWFMVPEFPYPVVVLWL